MLRFFLCLCLLIVPLQAEDTVNVFKKTHQQKMAVIAQQQQISKEAEQLQKTLLALAQMIQDKKMNLIRNRQSIGLKLPSLVRLGRSNPLCILTDASASQNILRSLIVLRTVTTSLKNQVQQAQTDLQEIQTVSADMESKKEALAQLVQELEGKKVELAAEESENLKNLTKEELVRLSKEDDINSLLAEAGAYLSRDKALAKKSAAKRDLPFRWLERPVAGKMITNSRLQKKFNAKGVGVIFETKKNSEVLAPSAGVVAFVGPFQSQEDILILDHGEKVYSVFMGMDKIDAEVGQNVYAGFKLGTMAGYGKDAPKLYFELRQNGEAIDSKPYFVE